MQGPPKHNRITLGVLKHFGTPPADSRVAGFDRLAKATQRFTTRVREGSQPHRAVMRDEAAALDANTNGSDSCSTREHGKVTSADLQRELPSVSDQARQRQSAVASTSQPSSTRQGRTNADPSKGVPVFVMLPLDTVSSPTALAQST